MKNLLVLLGPTGVGKTELSLLLAERLGSPIINADSRQIYKDIEIGTASPTAEELARVEHFFVHTLALDEYYSAAEYEKDVMQLLPQLFQSHDTVLLSGGSMMYIDAVTKGIDDIPTVDEETREMLRHRFEKEGLEPLLAELKLLDPHYYEIVDKRNHKRVVHALEICYMTGKPFTFFRTNSTKERPFRIVKFGLRRERANLFARINARVDKMMEEGLLDEARRVYPLRELNSLNTVGYKEMFKVIAGEWELPMAVERMKKNTRVYAKKQMTWYQHDADIHWLDADKMNIQEMLKTIENEVFVA
ncbi:MAG: tRNA (adenosine(37)-N6)-dimethylallyltransferase MiaA [Bacteroidaceae bacterium]|nr:tRNA (adenosine(37)-N6)-dimethylallyltransferase MiaA [Bacteroidaceae bacterium]MBS7323702.1 tRNA (adenosine(37)-N6)-dimethylallyltransferase MiaA [Bacteroidaceae bacterium]MDD7527019.1 tRNA (adenosine(37)-N6)-dimethylallyltransferase MiaA [Prevotellaceae bacterium]MDY5760757.1 tRNA (adenosine(37)-N6)-dimethylallyltransferase MiaA [Bacteroidaceae bacterium]MDY6257977.1 tRNA (adenosine(37)-N6)-dimethylallyltransferase MiaA [Bacteroidaceae bacterium]